MQYTFKEKLEEIILKNYGKVGTFSAESGISRAGLANTLDPEKGTNLGTLIEMCDHLDLKILIVKKETEIESDFNLQVSTDKPYKNRVFSTLKKDKKWNSTNF